MCETLAVTFWKCLNCSDEVRKQGILLCDECLSHGTPVRRRSNSNREKRWRQRAQVAGKDLRRCNSCAEPFTQTRAWRQDHGQESSGKRMRFVLRQHTNKSFMDLHVHGMPASPLHRLPRQRNLAKHPQRERLDRPRHHPFTHHLFHQNLSLTRATSTCSSCFLGLTHCLSYRQSNGNREDWTAGTLRSD